MPHTEFLQLRGRECIGARYANLWESNSPTKKNINMIVFYEYYKVLKRVIHETPWINIDIVDMYHNRLDFIADRNTIYLRPKGFRKDDWAIGLFRMTAQDVEDVIKDFDEEWKKELEYATAGTIPTDTAPTDPLDKGKDKVGSKRKDAVEVPPAARKKKKFKASNPATHIALTEDDYDLIAARLKEEMWDSFQVMQTLHDKLQSTIDKPLLELKALIENTTMMQT